MKSPTSIARTQTVRQWRRQPTVRIVHVDQGQVAGVAEDVVLVDVVVADAALVAADVADLAAAVIAATAAAAVADINLKCFPNKKRAQLKDCALFLFVA